MEKMLNYDRSIVPQETGWWCGPAATQIALNARGIKLREADIAAEIEQIENPGRGDDRDGTDYIGLIEQFLDRKVPEARYTSVYMPNDPPLAAQKERLWKDLTRSIAAGWPVIVNIVAPPTNLPRAVKGSVPPPYPRHLTTFHYAVLAGYDDDPSARAVWWADSAAFGGITGWWGPFDGPGSVCTLIPPKGYCFADVSAAPSPAPALPQGFNPVEWDIVLQTVVGVLLKDAKAGDVRATRALAKLEQINRAALETFIKEGAA